MRAVIKETHSCDVIQFVSQEFIKKEIKNTLTIMPGRDEFAKDPSSCIGVAIEFQQEMKAVGDLMISVSHFDQALRQMCYDLGTFTGVVVPTAHKLKQMRSTDLRDAFDRISENPADEIFKGLQYDFGKYAIELSNAELKSGQGDAQGEASLGHAEMQGALYNMAELDTFPEITNILESALIAQEVSLACHHICTALIKMSKQKTDECMSRMYTQLQRLANGCRHMDFCVVSQVVEDITPYLDHVSIDTDDMTANSNLRENAVTAVQRISGELGDSYDALNNAFDAYAGMIVAVVKRLYENPDEGWAKIPVRCKYVERLSQTQEKVQAAIEATLLVIKLIDAAIGSPNEDALKQDAWLRLAETDKPEGDEPTYALVIRYFDMKSRHCAKIEFPFHDEDKVYCLDGAAMKKVRQDAQDFLDWPFNSKVAKFVQQRCLGDRVEASVKVFAATLHLSPITVYSAEQFAAMPVKQKGEALIKTKHITHYDQVISTKEDWSRNRTLRWLVSMAEGWPTTLSYC